MTLTIVSFEECLELLISMSLVDRDPVTNTVSVHRVIQLEFRKSLGDEDRRQALKLASKLLLEAFPKQVNGLSLRREWPQCVTYIQHILSIINHYKACQVSPEYPGEFFDLAVCLSSAAW